MWSCRFSLLEQIAKFNSQEDPSLGFDRKKIFQVIDLPLEVKFLNLEISKDQSLGLKVF